MTARQTGLPLDKMTIETHVTTMTAPEQVQEPPADGAFVHGRDRALIDADLAARLTA